MRDMKTWVMMVSCGLLLLGGCDSDDSGMSFDDLQQLDQSEQTELLALSEQAARNWNFSSAEDYLAQAEEKGYAPDTIEHTKQVIRTQRQAYRKDQERKAEARRREEQRRLAEAQRSGGGGSSGGDLKNWCLAASGKFPDFCYNIHDGDMKNACLGMTKYPNNCYSINDGDLKNVCLGMTKYPNNCYSIHDGDLKNLCMSRAEGSNFCFSIHDSDLKAACLGISQSSDSCYTIH